MLPIDRTIVPDVIRVQKLLTLTRDATVGEAARLMAERQVGAVLVVEGGRLLGIFTERDVVARCVAPGRDSAATTLGEVMTPDPDTLRPDDSVRSALELMSLHKYRHLPVIDGQRLVGIVSIRDLYSSVMDQLEADILLLAQGLIHG
jgi:CBS domain-containing protein